MNDDFENLHYGRPNPIGKYSKRLHGPRAWYQIGHKGGITIYHPIGDGHQSSRVAYYRDVNEMQTAITDQVAKRLKPKAG